MMDRIFGCVVVAWTLGLIVSLWMEMAGEYAAWTFTVVTVAMSWLFIGLLLFAGCQAACGVAP